MESEQSYNAPIDTVQRAAAMALDTVETALRAQGARAVQCVVTLQAANVPVGELDACSAAVGIGEEPQELLVVLLTAATAVAKTLGVDLRIVPMPIRGEG